MVEVMGYSCTIFQIIIIIFKSGSLCMSIHVHTLSLLVPQNVGSSKAPAYLIRTKPTYSNWIIWWATGLNYISCATRSNFSFTVSKYGRYLYCTEKVYSVQHVDSFVHPFLHEVKEMANLSLGKAFLRPVQCWLMPSLCRWTHPPPLGI